MTLERAIRARPGPALIAYLMGGYPSREAFPGVLAEVASVADVVEVGVPFSDPMADGTTLQRANAVALAGGTHLEWILEHTVGLSVPVVLMGYCNPFLAYGAERLAQVAHVAGYVVPDLPLEESGMLPLPLVQLVSPVSSPERLGRSCDASRGFVYAVSATGTTGGRYDVDLDWLGRVRARSSLPVAVGFGVRRPEQVARLRSAADAVVVGSALVQALDRGESPAAFLRRLMAPREVTS